LSKFDKLLSTTKGRDKTSSKKSSTTAASSSSKRRGRPTGKRSDPDFEQTTAYIRKDTHRNVKIALLEEGEGREYSELVEELLSKWLKARK
jgi:hypothetical protein